MAGMFCRATEEYAGEFDHLGDHCLDDFLRDSRRVLEERGLDREYRLQVVRHGRWFLIAGRVDSHQTKSILFGLVPEIDEARWIVDRLHIGRRA
jgi:hypothetical protein